MKSTIGIGIVVAVFVTGCVGVSTPSRWEIAGGTLTRTIVLDPSGRQLQPPEITFTNFNFGSVSSNGSTVTGGMTVNNGSNSRVTINPAASGTPSSSGPALVVSGGGATIIGGTNSATIIQAARDVSDSWAEVFPSIPSPVNRTQAAVFRGSMYVAGGYAPEDSTTNVWRFDGTNWAQVAGLPAERGANAVAVLGDFLYSIGGYDLWDMNVTTNVYRYDGTNWTEVASLPEPLYYMQAAEYAGKLYVGCGGLTTNIYCYDGTNWAQAGGIAKIETAAMCAYNGNLYSIGGASAETWNSITNVWKYDGTNWTEVAGLPSARGWSSAATNFGYMYAFGGGSAWPSPATNVYRYDGTNWAEVAGLPAARIGAPGATFNGKIYCFGGYGPVGGMTNVYAYSRALVDFPILSLKDGDGNTVFEVSRTGMSGGAGAFTGSLTLDGNPVSTNPSSASVPSGTLVMTNTGSAGQVAIWDGGSPSGVQSGYWGTASGGGGGDMYLASNNVVTGGLNVSNASPELRVTTTNGGYGRLTRSNPNTLQQQNVVLTPGSISGSGGSVVFTNGYYRHTFTNSGTFTLANAGLVDVLVVGGGGGGASIFGGGGGGGVIVTQVSLIASNYTVTVGEGGGGGPAGSVTITAGTNGQSSSFWTVTALGGGGGGSYNRKPGNGGCGGGGGSTVGYTPGGTGTVSQGFDGGYGRSDYKSAGGGGGGSAQIGGNASWGQGGVGGNGVSNNYSTGIYTNYGGGGGGASCDVAGGGGAGGLGGGGNGANAGVAAKGDDGVPSSGGGGGAGSQKGANWGGGGIGGSGIVVIRYGDLGAVNNEVSVWKSEDGQATGETGINTFNPNPAGRGVLDGVSTRHNVAGIEQYRDDSAMTYPTTDNFSDLGKTGNRWKKLYLSGSINIGNVEGWTGIVTNGIGTGTTNREYFCGGVMTNMTSP